jgi:hypothetical protein
LAFHELLGEPASDSANDDGGDPTDLLFFHCRFLLGRPSLQTILLIRILFGTSSKTSLRHKRGRHLPRRVQNGKWGAASEGLYEVTVGDETAKAGPGSIVFIPRNVVHRFKNVGFVTGRMLGWSLPGGQDHYLKAISELAAGGGFTSEKVMEISKTFDTHFPVEP